MWDRVAGQYGHADIGRPLEEATKIVAIGVQVSAAVASKERSSSQLRLIERAVRVQLSEETSLPSRSWSSWNLLTVGGAGNTPPWTRRLVLPAPAVFTRIMGRGSARTRWRGSPVPGARIARVSKHSGPVSPRARPPAGVRGCSATRLGDALIGRRGRSTVGPGDELRRAVGASVCWLIRLSPTPGDDQERSLTPGRATDCVCQQVVS
jgi:hypothetical protein